LNWVGVTWGREADAARASDEASTTDTLGAGVAGVEFRARLDTNGRKQGLLGMLVLFYDSPTEN
jgi:hypothetical protein